MGYCDICNAVGSWETVSAQDFQKAVNNGFNPVKLGMLKFNHSYTPESWKVYARSPMVCTTAWALCSTCMPKINPYLDSKIDHQENKKEGCFIATACYGDYDANEVLILREFRDKVLFKSIFGRVFIYMYYRISPPIASFITQSNKIKGIIKIILIKPLTKFASNFLKK
jgi:hypothetical protein